MSIILATLIAGLGLFFTGVKLVSTHLKQLTGRRFRLLVAKWSKSGWLAGLWGALAGAVAQSSAAIAFIVVSLISSGMMPARNGIPIILWSNPGVSVLVFLAVLRVDLLALFLLGVSGISFAFDKPRKYRNLVGAVFGVSLLLYGLSLMRTGAAPVSESEWFQHLLIQSTVTHGLSFIAGALCALVAQSAAVVSVVAITLMKGGLFNTDQTMMIIYGSNMGSSCIAWFLSTGLRGTAKQVAMSQVFFNFVGVLIFFPLFVLEVHAELPLVKAAVTSVAKHIELQMALVYLVFNLVTCVFLTLALNPYYWTLQRIWPATREENDSKVAFIYENALNDPETAMDLAEREQSRLLERLPSYMEGLRANLTTTGNKYDVASIHEPFVRVAAEVQSFLSELHTRDLPRQSSERLLILLNRQNFIESIEDNVHRLADTVFQLKPSGNLKEVSMNFVEGLDAILLTALDAVRGPEASNADTLVQITSDRGGLMEKIRTTYLSSERELSQSEKSLLLHITNLFELIVWLLRHLGLSLAAGRDFSSR